MMTGTGVGDSPRNAHKVEIGTEEDLQLLLQQKLCKEVMVVKYKTSSLLPPGENFACSIFEVQATLKRRDGDPPHVIGGAVKEEVGEVEEEVGVEEEELHLIGKMFPTEDCMRQIFDFSIFFKKEIFFYERLLPAFRDIEAEIGLEGSEFFDIAPKIFGTRSSLDPASDRIDDTALILMENLKKNGYYTLDKIEGLDLNHSIMAMKNLARFHALGIACKHHRPVFFYGEVLDHAKTVPVQTPLNLFDLMFEQLCEDPRIADYRYDLLTLLGPDMQLAYGKETRREPWLSIAHLDIWTNNIMYRKDRAGVLDGMKMIDFQNYTYSSPLRDLPYFLCTSTAPDVFRSNIDELLDLYYATFVSELRKMRCDPKPYSRDSFDGQLKLDSAIEFFHSILAIKFFYTEIDVDTYDSSQLEAVIIHGKLTPAGYDKWHDIVTTYVKRGWIQDLS